MNIELYPLKFTPILKDKIWGGNALNNIFNKSTQSKKLGESWELSGYRGDESIISNGNLAGKTLTELIDAYKGDLIGLEIYEKYGLSFPLLFKLIDANDNLSIQVHPNDETALKRHESFGKTEMWYVVAAEPDASLIIGLKNEYSKDEYLVALEAGNVESLLQSVSVAKGDVFFIPAGLVHAIGKGVVVAEIQQSSDITYRIYDYKRTDYNGNERELHTNEALDVIDFSTAKEPKTIYQANLNEVTPLVQCNYFTTNVIRFNTSILRNYTLIDSFVAYMCLDGNFEIEFDGEKTTVNKGDTVLIPALLNNFFLLPENEVTLLEVYIT